MHRLKGERHRLSFDEWVARVEGELAAARSKLEKDRAAVLADSNSLLRAWDRVHQTEDAIKVACREMLDGIEIRLIVAESVAKAAVSMALDVHSATDLAQAKSAAADLHQILAWARKKNGIVASAVETHRVSRAARRLPTEGIRLRIAALRHRIATTVHGRSVQIDTSSNVVRHEVCEGRVQCATAPFAFCVVAEAQTMLESEGFVSVAQLFADIEEMGKRRKLESVA